MSRSSVVPWWISWYTHRPLSEFELHSPWWVSGYSEDGDMKRPSWAACMFAAAAVQSLGAVWWWALRGMSEDVAAAWLFTVTAATLAGIACMGMSAQERRGGQR